MKKLTWIIGAVFSLLIMVFVCLMLSLGNKTINPLTTVDVCEVLKSQGYQPVNCTDSALAANPGWDLKGCIKVDNGEFEFEFYEFENESSAVGIYGSAYRHIRTNKMATPKRETEARASNYRMYWLEAGENYAISMYVGTTAVYAFCNKDYAAKLDDILFEMGYCDR